MNVSIEIGLLVSAFLIFCSILMSKTGYRFGIPTLLMFLLAGIKEIDVRLKELDGAHHAALEIADQQERANEYAHRISDAQ